MFSRLAQFALIALALTTGYPVKAAPLVYGTYYDDKASASCSVVLLCRALFSQLPSDKLVMFQRINCAVQSSQPLQTATLRISATFNGSPLSSRFLPIALPTPQLIDSVYWTSWETNTRYLVGNGRFPFVDMALPSSGAMAFNCTIIGDLVTPIQ